MTFQEALYKSIEEFGVEILNEPRLVNVINDLHGFDENPSLRFILLRLITEYKFNFWGKGVKNINNIVHMINKKYGLDKSFILMTINSMNDACETYYCHCKKAVLVNVEDIKNGIVDEFGVTYSQDGKRLLKGADIPEYRIKPGTQFICDKAFWKCNSLKSVTIPHGVRTIGKLAFSYTSCEIIQLPSTILYILHLAFAGILNLKYINIPQNIRGIAMDNILAVCENLENVVVESPKYNLENGILYNSDYTSIISTIPKLVNNSSHINEQVLFIGGYSFAGCLKLNEIEIPQNIITIGRNAFEQCLNLRKISLPLSLKMISKNAFLKCKKLEEVNVRRGDFNGSYFEWNEFIETQDDSKQSRLKKVNCCLGDSAFAECASLKVVEIPDEIRNIRASVFEGCKSLREIYIMGELNEVEENVFKNITSLVHLFVPIEDYYVDEYRNKFKKIFPSGKNVVQPCNYTMANYYEEMDTDNLSEWFQMYPDWND